MLKKFNQILDAASDFLAHRKGLLPLIGILLVLTNAILQFFPSAGWFAATNFLLHLGVIIPGGHYRYLGDYARMGTLIRYGGQPHSLRGGIRLQIS